MQYDAPATQLTPLVREAGRLVVTDQRVYFQPLHNVTGGSPVLSHPLAAVAAVAHRSSSLRPIGEASLMTACFPMSCSFMTAVLLYKHNKAVCSIGQSMLTEIWTPERVWLVLSVFGWNTKTLMD